MWSFILFVLVVIALIYGISWIHRKPQPALITSLPPKHEITKEDFACFSRDRYDMERAKNSDTSPLPKRIFMYWHEEINDQTEATADDFVKRNIDYLRRILPEDYTLTVYNEKTIAEEFQSSNEDFEKYKEMRVQHYADFIRVYLLKKYGGVWMDASLIVIDPSFIERIYRDYEESPFDIFMFEYHLRNGNQEMNGKYLENWFMVAPQKSPFIEALYKEFKEAMDQGFMEYKQELKEKKVNMKFTIEEEGNVYMMQHTIVRKLLMLYNYKLNLGQASESMFKLQDECGWDHQCLMSKMLDREVLARLYGIKLVGGHRMAMSESKMSETLFQILMDLHVKR